MTILLIDTEHDRVTEHPTLGPPHRARLDAARERVAAPADGECRTCSFRDVTLAWVERLAPEAIVIGGNTTDWQRYDPASLTGLIATIRAAPAPILGICAGHQLIGRAHGAEWGPLGPLREDEPDPDPRFAAGQRKERGFLPVQVDPTCPLFRGLEPSVPFFQSHYWQLATVPSGFVARASSSWSAIQAIERRDRPVFGVQFHPERSDQAHPQGAAVLRNFFALAGARASGH